MRQTFRIVPLHGDAVLGCFLIVRSSLSLIRLSPLLCCAQSRDEVNGREERSPRFE
jgi:hypothetical protein